jgi:SAM-dependent methyltransferase
MTSILEDFVEREHLGLHWRLPPEDEVARAIAQGSLWRPEATRILTRVVRPGMHVLDADATQLWFTLLLARMVGPTGRVTACAADPAARAQLHWHLQRNQLTDRVHVVPGRLEDMQVLPARIDVARLVASDGEVDEVTVAGSILRRCRPALLLHRRGERGSSRLLRALRELDHELVDAAGLPFPTDAHALEYLDDAARGADVLALPGEVLAGMSVRVVDDLDELRQAFGLLATGRILEDDIDEVENECERWGRKRRDAEVLMTLAANCRGDALELGTSHGRGTVELAGNLTGGVVHTVNVLPEQLAAAGDAGVHVTHLLKRDEIGSFWRARGARNVRQIHANTLTWRPTAELDGVGLAFVDACHDADAVRSDSQLCWRLLRPGGFLVWHDWSPFARSYEWIDSVMRGAAAFLADHRLHGPVVHLRGSWTGILRKGNGPAR